MPTSNKIFALLVLVLCLFVVSCGDSGDSAVITEIAEDDSPEVDAPSEEDNPEQPTPVPDTPDENNDIDNSDNLGPGFGAGQSDLLPVVSTAVVLPNRAYLDLAPELQAVLPADCLVDQLTTIFCFSTENRTMIAVQPDGTPFWTFPVPGDNATNRIEGLHVLSSNQFAVVANTTSDPANPQQEMSIFNADGSFCCTYSLFDKLLNLAGEEVDQRFNVNIQGEPLLSVAQPELDPSQETHSSRLFVAGNYYDLIDGGDPTSISDWRQTGVIINSINVEDGSRRSTHLLPGAVISDPALEFLSIDGDSLVLALSERNYRIAIHDAGSVVSGIANVPLSVDVLSEQIPEALSTLRGDYVVSLRDQILSELPLSLSAQDLDCNYPPSTGSTISCTFETDPTTVACDTGVIIESYRIEKTFIAGGTGEMIVRLQSLQFDQCIIGARELSGRMEQSTREGGIRRGNITSEGSVFSDLTLNVTRLGQDSSERYFLDGSLLESVSTGLFSGVKSTREIATMNFKHEIQNTSNTGASLVSLQREITNHNYLGNTTRSDTAPTFDESGTLDLTIPGLINQQHDVEFAEPPPASGGSPSGSFSVVESTGASLTISPVDTSAINNMQVEFLDSAGSSTSYLMSAEGLRKPWSVIQ